MEEATALGDLVPGFTPENARERVLARDPVLTEGLAWGKPRYGHPEGSVGAHVADLLRAIDARGETGERRSELRFIALVHDALKNRVQEWRPRTGENHHAMRARRFAEKLTDDERLLTTIELHDRPYSIWKRVQRTGDPEDAAVTELVGRLPDLPLFMCFVELDGSTEGKEPAPLDWFRDELRARGKLR